MENLALVSKLEQDLKSLDISRINEYQERLENLTQGANTMNAPLYIKDFILAYDEANILLSKATRLLHQADTALKTAQAIAYMDNAPDYLKEHGMKDTSAARERYIDLDPAVQKAANAKALAESLTLYLRNKMQVFRLAHDSIKKIAYASEMNNSAYEGF
jgi:hypothetical protein